jgi:uncharacterized membrane protein YeaQ/YmgE (transglycosylase-associated protein family)
MFILWCVILGIMTSWITGIRMKGDAYGPLMDMFSGARVALASGNSRLNAHVTSGELLIE